MKTRVGAGIRLKRADPCPLQYLFQRIEAAWISRAELLGPQLVHFDL